MREERKAWEGEERERGRGEGGEKEQGGYLDDIEGRDGGRREGNKGE
jgi:hypothetical protein